MKILVSQIDPNPHRDLARNPISEEQVNKLITSIRQTGFWDNVVVRPHPDQPGRFQLAYGHSRIEACRQLGMTEVDLPSRDLSDYQMLSAMISENHTQQGTLPTRVVFENIVAALRLAERMLNSTNTVEEFNDLLKLETCSVPNKSSKWSAIQYGQAKSAIAEEGDGFGRGFVEHIMPEGTCPSAEVLQSVIDSFYKERRQVAAERRARVAEEARLAALAEKEKLENEARLKQEQEADAKKLIEEAEREEREAIDLAEKADDEKARQAALKAIDKQRNIKQSAVKRAGKAMKERQKIEKGIDRKQQEIAEKTKKAASERARAKKFAQSVIDPDLLQRLDSTSKVGDVVRLVKRENIPAEYHEELIEKAQAWASDSSTTKLAGTAISVRGASWWNSINKKSEAYLRRMQEKAHLRAFIDAYGDTPLEQAALHILGKILKPVEKANDHFIHLQQGAEFFDTLADKDLTRLIDPLTSVKNSYLDCARQLEAILYQVNAIKRSREREINPITEPLLLVRC